MGARIIIRFISKAASIRPLVQNTIVRLIEMSALYNAHFNPVFH